MSRRFTCVTIALAGATLGLAAGCSARPLDATGGAGVGGATATGAGGAGAGASGGRQGGGFVPNRNVDILFLIDDSGAMTVAQTNLARSFPQFVTALEALPGGLPNLHIAVVSSDMGAGNGSISQCHADEAKAGVFQYAARRDCTATNLGPGATYVSNIGGVANYTGALADVLACIAPLGESGCGFEHQLAAVARALGADGRPAPPENLGFLRVDAALVVVLLTNEDDCSAPPGSLLFENTKNLTLASALGPIGSFRCNEFGHLCSGSRPPRLAPNGNVGDTVVLADCVPAEASGMLTPVGTLVSQLRALKIAPDEQIVVAAIAGPATPYGVRWFSPPRPDTGPWPFMMHSCDSPTTTFADPAVRIEAFADAFGGSDLLFNICDESYAPSLERIAQRIGDVIAPAP